MVVSSRLLDNVVDYICWCPTCISLQEPNLKDDPYHSLEHAYEPRQVVYLDLLGPISGINLGARYVLTALDGYSRFLSIHPIKSKKATIHDKKATDFLYL